ncbi:MAG TPA: aldehyde dehydrogenase [Syntrophomonadaceae bacterium]|nr:aldehyde dehydrogenase [Syntrophomonadaceae bacterium]
MNSEDFANRMEEQRTFFQRGRTMDLGFRKEALRRLEKGVKEHEKDILEALRLDLGRASVEGYTADIAPIYADISFILGRLGRMIKGFKVPTPLAFAGGSSRIMPEPLGLVLIMGPWNYPFHLLLRPLVGALAAGNCAVLKPSEMAPHSSALIHNMIGEIFPSYHVTVLEGGVEEATTLLEQRFDSIFYTGNPTVGRIVMEAAARHLTPVILELGGKSPCIVDKDANPRLAARRIAWGKFLNAGQTCVAPDYLLVHREIKEALLQEVQSAILEFYGEGPQESPDYGRIVNDRHFSRLAGYLEAGRLICGGQTDKEDKYIAPTLLEGITENDPIMHEEIFGPILPVLEFDNLDEVINMVNRRPKPLALYLFTRNRKNQLRVIRETSSGGVCINDTISHMVSNNLPFGGVGESGMGQYHGAASFYAFSHMKSILRASSWFDAPKYPPYRIDLTWIKRLMRFT